MPGYPNIVAYLNKKVNSYTILLLSVKHKISLFYKDILRQRR